MILLGGGMSMANIEKRHKESHPKTENEEACNCPTCWDMYTSGKSSKEIVKSHRRAVARKKKHTEE